MIDMMITRLIASAVAAVLLGYALYVAAFVKHRNEIRDEANRGAVWGGKESPADDWLKIRKEKTATWYLGYRLALVGLIVVAGAVGWAAAWAVGTEHALTWVEDCAVAAAGAVIGGLVLDKYIIHPIANGRFFEKVEDPIVEYFLQNGCVPSEKVDAEPEKAPEEIPADEKEFDVSELTFDEKVKLIEVLRKTL